MRENQQRPEAGPVGDMERLGPESVHGASDSAGMANFTADPQFSEDAADFIEKAGHATQPRRTRSWIPWSRGHGRHRLA